jgi:hypothetical protein
MATLRGGGPQPHQSNDSEPAAKKVRVFCKDRKLLESVFVMPL